MNRHAAAAVCSLVLVGLAGCASAGPDPAAKTGSPTVAALTLTLQHDPHEPENLGSSLASDPLAYYRFINAQWSAVVCENFPSGLRSMPPVGLHGDAHVMQYAFTNSEYGLDDFDDAARGPAVLDFVRFLSSVELIVRRRGWQDHREQLFDEFFRGYRLALQDPSYRPPTPATVTRLRQRPARSQIEFIEWAESLMEPLDPAELPLIEAGVGALAGQVHELRPDLPSGYFKLKRAGRFRMGIGSALTPKTLGRFEGPTLAPDDDFIMEGKALSDLSRVGCLSLPDSGEALRVITGIRDVGRIHHNLVAILPKTPLDPEGRRDWWVRTWEPTYSELAVDDILSPGEFAEIIHDAGAQLGCGHFASPGGSHPLPGVQTRLDALATQEGPSRLFALQMTNDLIEAWKIFRSTEEGTVP